MASDNKGKDLSTPELVKAKLNKNNFVVDLDAFDDFLADMESDNDSFAGENKHGSIDDEDSSLFTDDSDFESLDSPMKAKKKKAFNTRALEYHSGDLEQLFSKDSSKNSPVVPSKQMRSASETLSRSSDHGSRREEVRGRKRDGLSQSEHKSRGTTSANLWDDAMKSSSKSKIAAAKSPSSETKSLSLGEHRITAAGSIVPGSDHGHRRPEESSPSISSTRKVTGTGASLPSRRGGADPLSHSEHKPRRRGLGDELSRSDHSTSGSRGLSLTRGSDHIVTATGNILSVSSHGSRQRETSSSRPSRYASTQALAARRGRGDELSQSDHSATGSRGLSLTRAERPITPTSNMLSGSGHGHRRRERSAGASASRRGTDPLSRSDHGPRRRGRRDELPQGSGHESSGPGEDFTQSSTPTTDRTPRRGKKDSLSHSEHVSRRRGGDSKSPVPTSNRSLSSERRPIRRRRDDLTQSEHGRVRSSRQHRSDSDQQGEQDPAVVSPVARRSRRPLPSRSAVNSKSPVRTTAVKPRSANSAISTSTHRLVELGQF